VVVVFAFKMKTNFDALGNVTAMATNSDRHHPIARNG